MEKKKAHTQICIHTHHGCKQKFGNIVGHELVVGLYNSCCVIVANIYIGGIVYSIKKIVVCKVGVTMNGATKNNNVARRHGKDKIQMISELSQNKQEKNLHILIELYYNNTLICDKMWTMVLQY